jgi:Cytochrome P460
VLQTSEGFNDSPLCGATNKRDHHTVRTPLALLVLALGLAGAVAVVAKAAPSANGLPSYTDGYTKWKKLNRKPILTPGAHNGVKNVFASKPRGARGRFPNGTVIVKSIAQPGAKGLPGQVAVMHKVNGRWRWVEYQLSEARYGVLAKGQLCVSCHMQARTNDWVFTKG